MKLLDLMFGDYYPLTVVIVAVGYGVAVYFAHPYLTAWLAAL